MDAKNNGVVADFYVGLESGLVERYGHIYEEAWSCAITNKGKEYFGYSSGLKVPDYILKRMDELKLEHCMAMEIIEKEFVPFAKRYLGHLFRRYYHKRSKP